MSGRIEFYINKNDRWMVFCPESKIEWNHNIYVKMFKYNGQAVDNMIKCVNAWPTSISESPLDMRGSEAIFRSVVFQFDYWDLVKV